VHTFGGEIPRVPGAIINNTYLVAFRLLNLKLRLFTASFQRELPGSMADLFCSIAAIFPVVKLPSILKEKEKENK